MRNVGTTSCVAAIQHDPGRPSCLRMHGPKLILSCRIEPTQRSQQAGVLDELIEEGDRTRKLADENALAYSVPAGGVVSRLDTNGGEPIDIPGYRDREPFRIIAADRQQGRNEKPREVPGQTNRPFDQSVLVTVGICNQCRIDRHTELRDLDAVVVDDIPHPLDHRFDSVTVKEPEVHRGSGDRGITFSFTPPATMVTAVVV